MCTVADCPTLACLRSHERQVRICERRAPDGAVAGRETIRETIRAKGPTTHLHFGKQAGNN